MAIHAPITGALDRATLFHPRRGTRFHRLLSTLSADEVEDAIEALIARLDQMTPDEDMEDDDPAGGNILDEPHDQHENLIPLYGIDQTTGPINEVEACNTYLRRHLEEDKGSGSSAAPSILLTRAMSWWRYMP